MRHLPQSAISPPATCNSPFTMITHLNVVRPDESYIEPESGAQPMFPGPLNRINTPTFDARFVGPNSWTTIWGMRPRNPGATIP